MTSTNRRQEIASSLNNLDALQSEQVLEYIRALVQREREVPRHQRIKRQALKEIRQALREPLHSF